MTLSNLPYDVARCHDSDCTYAEFCLRYLRRNDEGDRVVHMESPRQGDVCRDLIPHGVSDLTKLENL